LKAQAIMAPMVIDGGVGGLEQSFHHPEAGQSAHNSSAQEEQRDRSEGASQKNGEEDLLKVVNDIVGLLDEDKKKAGRRAIERSRDFDIKAGVPQKSPLSPVLFLLYIATLYKDLQAAYQQLIIIGFADDTNLLAVGSTFENIKNLLKAA
jgi:hypothetical protein